MIERRPQLSTGERIMTLVVGSALYLYLPTGLMWGFVSFHAAVKTFVIGFALLWLWVWNKERRQRNEDQSTVDTLVTAAGSD